MPSTYSESSEIQREAKNTVPTTQGLINKSLKPYPQHIHILLPSLRTHPRVRL